MKGRDLIIYILEHNLEDEEIFKDGKIVGLLTCDEVAAKLGVGVSTVKALFEIKKLPGIEIGETVYIFGNYEKLRGEHEVK